MGSALPKGGPAGLFIAFLIWGSVMWAVNECFAEMVTLVPVPSPFVRFGSEWVDSALGFGMVCATRLPPMFSPKPLALDRLFADN